MDKLSTRQGKAWAAAAWATTVLTGCATEDEAPAAPAEAIDVASAAAHAGRHAATGHTLTQLALLTSALRPDRAAAAAAKTPGELAGLIAAAADSLKANGCSGASKVHVPGKPSLSVTLPVSNCKFRGQTIGGLIDIEVSAAASGSLEVRYKIASGKVRDRALTADVRLVADGAEDDVTLTSLVAEGLTIAGSARWRPDLTVGRLSVATANGTAQHASETVPTSFALTAVEQNFAACYPATGTIQLQSTLPLVAPKAKAGEPVAVSWSVPFDADTPRDGTLDASYRLGDGTTALQLPNVVMAAYGDCPDGTSP